MVCGYIQKDNHMTSLVLASGPPLEVPQGHGNEDAVWIGPSMVCTVSYMEKTANGGMRQPVFKGLREDKTTEECIETR